MGKEPRIVGERNGKPVVRVPTDYVSPYQRLETFEGQALYKPILSGKSEVALGRDKALRAAQDVDRNNETIRGALDRKANTVVGPNLFPVPNPDIRWLGQDIDWMLDYREAALSAFKEWGNDERCLCDAEGHYNFGGLMWQAFRTLSGADAEVAGYIGYDEERAQRYGHKWASFVHLIDPVRVSTPSGMMENETLYEGRQLDEWGRMIGIHVSRTHPSDTRTLPQSWEFIPRETGFGRPMAFHWFFKRRAGMQRAMTSLAASLRHIKMLDTLDDTLLQTAATNAVIATYIKTTMDAAEVAAHLAPAGDGQPSAFDMKLDAYDKMELKVGNKRIPVLGPNDEIAMESLKGSMIDADAFRNAFLRNFASAVGVSFEELSLDFSRSSYSSARQSIIVAGKQVAFERHMFTTHLATLIYSAVIEEAFALNILRPPPGAPSFYEARQAYTGVRWIGPGMGWVDPLKEAKAATERWMLGAETLDGISSGQGADAFDNIRNKAMEIEMMRRHGVPVPGEAALPVDPETDAMAAEDGDAADNADNQQGQGRKKRDADGDGVLNEDEAQ